MIILWNAFGGSPSYGQNYLEAFGEQMTEVIPSEQFPAGASTVKFVGKQDYDIQGNRVKFFVPTLNAISYFDDNERLISVVPLLDHDSGKIVVSNNGYYVVVIDFLTKSMRLVRADGNVLWKEDASPRMLSSSRAGGTWPVVSSNGVLVDPAMICTSLWPSPNCEQEKPIAYDSNGKMKQFDFFRGGEILNAAFAISPEGNYLAISAIFSVAGKGAVANSMLLKEGRAGSVVALFDLRTFSKVWQHQFPWPSYGPVFLSENAARVLTTSGKNELRYNSGFTDWFQGGNLYVLDREGRTEHRLDAKEYGRGLGFLAISPDNEYAVFVARKDGHYWVHLLELATGHVMWKRATEQASVYVAQASMCYKARLISIVERGRGSRQIILNRDGTVLYDRPIQNLLYSGLSPDGKRFWASNTGGDIVYFKLNFVN